MLYNTNQGFYLSNILKIRDNRHIENQICNLDWKKVSPMGKVCPQGCRYVNILVKCKEELYE